MNSGSDCVFVFVCLSVCVCVCVKQVPVASMQEVSTQLERGGKNRAVGARDMNERSSRSHMIFNVRGEGIV